MELQPVPKDKIYVRTPLARVSGSPESPPSNETQQTDQWTSHGSSPDYLCMTSLRTLKNVAKKRGLSLQHPVLFIPGLKGKEAPLDEALLTLLHAKDGEKGSDTGGELVFTGALGARLFQYEKEGGAPFYRIEFANIETLSLKKGLLANPFSTDNHVEELEEVMGFLGRSHEAIHIVAHSKGAADALSCVEKADGQYPEFKGLVLVNPFLGNYLARKELKPILDAATFLLTPADRSSGIGRGQDALSQTLLRVNGVTLVQGEKDWLTGSLAPLFGKVGHRGLSALSGTRLHVAEVRRGDTTHCGLLKNEAAVSFISDALITWDNL
ncbi:MAG: hypothetical protein HYU64_15255 [Armatimonadetes bacterium]|nr:hypothetical protein [Armatimonadota bacterium]